MILQETSSLDQQISELGSEQDKLTAAEQQLQTKIEQFRSKKEVIKAQYSAAEAQVQISEAATGVGDEMADVGAAMQRAIDKTDQMQARASAVEVVQAAGTFDDLTTLGPAQDDVDRQLDAARRQERRRRRVREAQGRDRLRHPAVRAPRGRVRELGEHREQRQLARFSGPARPAVGAANPSYTAAPQTRRSSASMVTYNG